MQRVGHWLGVVILAALFFGLAFAAAVERNAAAALAPGEVTHLMQAESLVRDADLVYSRADFDRLLLRWHSNPAELDLVSGSAGQRIAYDRPFPYAVWLAPFVAVWPKVGTVVANVLVLVLATMLAMRALWSRLGGWAPVWIAVMIFASVTFIGVNTAGGGLFLLSVTVAGLSLLMGSSPRDPLEVRDLLAGALLAIPVAYDWIYLLLLVAAWWLPVAEARAQTSRRLIVGAATMLLAIAAVHGLAGGGAPFAQDGFGFTAATGYPLVDFSAAEWTATIERLRGRDYVAGFSWDPELRWWALVDLIFGRGIGLLPYFAPLILIAWVGSTRGYRRSLVLAAVAWLLTVVALRPFDVGGALDALGNGLFLPFYGALWLVPDPRRGFRRALVGGVVSGLIATLFLVELWRHPGVALDDVAAVAAHQTPAAQRWLPFETTQRWRVGVTGITRDCLSVEVIRGDAWAEQYHDRFVVEGTAELMFSAYEPLASARIELARSPAEHLVIRGGRIESESAMATDGASSTLAFTGLRRRHPTWRSPKRRAFYRVTLTIPETASALAVRLGNSDES